MRTISRRLWITYFSAGRSVDRIRIRGAFLALIVLAAAACTPQSSQPAPFDLVSPNRALNLLPLNPKWGAQVTSTRLPWIDQCGGGRPYEPPCTSQTINWSTTATTCGQDGHRNWSWATYDGTILWKDWSNRTLPFMDDDYNMALVRPDQAGYIHNQNHLQLEFDSDISIDHFDTPDTGWWHRFHNAVKDSDAAARAMLGGPTGLYAIATGIIGLDLQHGIGSELHPVVGLAIHVKADPNDDTWAVFAMNWGDEGYCSSGYQVLPSLPISFLLPPIGQASGVQVTRADFYCKCLSGTTWGLNPRSDGAELYVTLPQPSVVPTPFPGDVLGNADRLHGEIHLQWTGLKSSGPAAVAKPISVTESEGQGEIERRVEAAITQMTPAQRATFNRLAPSPRQHPPDEVRAPRSGQPPIPALTPTPALVRGTELASPVRDQQQQQFLSALKAAYGGQLPSNLTG